jgi:drug/metabolite transporter (DMT)-like permease
MQKAVIETAGAPPSAPPSAPALQFGAREWALLVLQSMLWGSAFFFIDLAKNAFPVLTLSSLRLLPAALILFVVALALRVSLRPLVTEWRKFLKLGFINNWFPFMLVIYGQHHVTGGVAAVFNATVPLFGLLLAHVLTRDEKLTATKLLGVVVGVGGVAVLTGGATADGHAATLIGKAALIVAAFCYALGSVYGRSFSHIPVVAVATGQMTFAFLLSVPLMLIVDRPWQQPMPSPEAVAAVVAMGTFGSALAALCYFTVLKRAGATNAMLSTLLLPLTPILLGAAFLGHTLTRQEMAGGLIVALALLIIDGRLFARLRAALVGRPAQ